MLALKAVSIEAGRSDRSRMLLTGVSASYPLSHFGAIVGPSGCGKTSLLKLIAGVAPGREDGEVWWNGRNLAVEHFHPSEIAYVPQFGIAHQELTVRENVRFALDLRVSDKSAAEREVACGLGILLAQCGRNPPARSTRVGWPSHSAFMLAFTPVSRNNRPQFSPAGAHPRNRNYHLARRCRTGPDHGAAG